MGTEDAPRGRRDFLAVTLMGLGLVASYGVLAVEGLLFVLPQRLKPKTRKLFAGNTGKFEVGSVKTIRDLSGGEILVKRDASGFEAFSSVCPHLGCRVHWEEENGRFFCPCHRGVFDENGIAIAGPPADANQRLATVPLTHDEQSGVLYLEVKDVGRRKV